MSSFDKIMKKMYKILLEYYKNPLIILIVIFGLFLLIFVNYKLSKDVLSRLEMIGALETEIEENKIENFRVGGELESSQYLGSTYKNVPPAFTSSQEYSINNNTVNTQLKNIIKGANLVVGNIRDKAFEILA